MDIKLRISFSLMFFGYKDIVWEIVQGEFIMTPTIFPTGTTIFKPDKCWSGYTVFQPREKGATLIDMNGNVVNRWRKIKGLPGPNKIFPGGFVLGSTGQRDPKYGFQDNVDLVQVNWEGKVVWKFNRQELVRDPPKKGVWMARQHHDYQREGNPVGYYVPGMDPFIDRGTTMVLCHTNVKNPEISEKLLLDDVVVEIDWDGKINWKWKCNEHFQELGFSEEARNILARNPGMVKAGRGLGDWMHINSVSWLGPNKWYDAGDQRFHPDNIIFSGRETNILAIIEKKTGKIVWRIGPEYTATEPLRRIGPIIGPHHVHLIPKGLPGEGNILVFDNGGWSGYGAPNPSSPTGRHNALRDNSRVLEFNPVKLEVVWQYPARRDEKGFSTAGGQVYSPLMSSAQRLLNGNTLITEGNTGRIFEVTSKCETVWEYINPYYERKGNQNIIYRSYRVPYDWIPQVDKPEELAIQPISNAKYRVPGSPRTRVIRVTDIQ